MSTGIRVDLTALTKVLTDLRRDVDQGLQPSTSGATGDLGDSAKFGSRSASGEVVAGATDVSYAASIASYNVGVHIENAHAIADLIEVAVARYGVADALAGEEFSSSAAVSSSTAAPYDGGHGLTPVFVGPLPAPKIPPQELTASPHALNWDSYDTPRMWTMVGREVSEEAWRQMHAFRHLSDALGDQQRRMLALRERLVAAWAPEGAGAEVLRVWDDHASALESDSMCAYMTAQALNGILETLADARAKIARLNETWTNVTTDYMPEWWDHKAELTNASARNVMLEADRAIADYRKKIAVPNQASPVQFDDRKHIGTGGGRKTPQLLSGAEGRSASRPSGSQSRHTIPTGHPSVPPPLPGTNPTHDGPGLAGAMDPVNLSPSNPPSVLPIPPSTTPYLPGGGAYVLPGPWSPEGRLIPMPSLETSGTRLSPGPTGGSSMFGIPSAHSGGGSERPGRQRMATEQWEVAKGGPSVIGESQPWRIEEEEPVDDLLDQFEKWIKVKGYPWEIESDEGSDR